MTIWNTELVFIIAGLAVFAAGNATEKPPFRDGIEYRYDWESQTLNSFVATDENGLKMAFKGQLSIIPKSDGASTKTVLRFRNVTFAVSSGNNVESPLKYSEYPASSEDLIKPFYAWFNGSQVTSVGFDKADSDWSRNIKRAVISAFQLAVPTSEDFSYNRNEDSIYGTCPARYFAVPTASGFSIEKERLLNECEDFSSVFDSPVKTGACSSGNNGPLEASSTAEYSVNMNRGHPEIFSLRSKGNIWLNPFGKKDSALVNTVEQTFMLEKTRRASSSAADHLFSLPLELKQSLRFDPKSANSELKQESLRQLTLIDLLALSETFDSSNNSSSALMNTVTERVGRLDVSQLKILHKELSVTSGNDKLESALQMFLDSVAMCGSQSALQFLHHLMSEKLLEEFTAARLVALYSVHVKSIDESMFPLLKTLADFSVPQEKWMIYKNAAVLSVASAVRKICFPGKRDRDPKCGTEILQQWTEHFYSKFDSSESYAEKALYLHALQNLGYGKFTPVLLEYCLNNSNPESLRIYVIQGMQQHCQEGNSVYNTLMRIFKDEKNGYQLRVSAASVLSRSVPSPVTLRAMARVLKSENHSQVRSFVYSILESAAREQNSCNLQLKKTAQDLLEKLSARPLTSWDSATYLYDFHDSESSFGNALNLEVVAGEYDDLPGYVRGSAQYFLNGLSYEPYSFSVRISGLRKYVAKFFGPELRREELNLPRLLSLLETLSVQPRESPEFNLEVAFNLHGKTVMYYFFDDEFLQNTMKLLRNFDFLLNFRANAQRTIVAAAASYSQPNDAGMAVSADLRIPLLLSLKGTIVKGKSSPRFGRLLDLTLFADISAEQKFSSQLTPLALSHEIVSERRAFVRLPIAAEISADVRKQQLDLEYTTPAVGYPMELHSFARTRSAISGESSANADWLKTNCHDCIGQQLSTNQKELHSGNLMNFTWPVIGLSAHAQVHDCSEEVSRGSHMASFAQAVNPLTMNTRGSKAAWAYLSFVRLQHSVFLQPFTKQCGFAAKIHRSVTNPVVQVVGRLRLKLQSGEDTAASWEAGKQALKAEVNFKGVSAAFDRKAEADITYEYSGAGAKNNLNIRVKVEKSAALKVPDFMVCLKAEAQYPAASRDAIDIRNLKEIPSAEGSIDFVMGEISSNQNQCPVDQFRLKVGIKARAGEDSLQQKMEVKTWPYDACKSQQGSGVWGIAMMPQTEACYRSALEFTTLRNFTFDFKFAEVPEAIGTTVSKLRTVVSTAMLPYWSISKSATSTELKDIGHVIVNASLSGGETQILDLYVAEGDKIHHFEKFPVPQQVSIALPSSRISSAMRVAYENDIIPSCVLTSKEVRSLDNVTFANSLSSCYALVSSDCRKDSQFAVLARKTTGHYPLAVKVHIGGHYVEIIPDESGRRSDFSVRANDLEVDATTGPYFIPEGRQKNYILKLQQQGNLYVISSPGAGILVHFSGHHVAVFPEWYYRSQHCGLCGDFNRETYNEFVGPEGCVLDNSSLFAAAYSLGETCFANRQKPQCSTSTRDVNL